MKKILLLITLLPLLLAGCSREAVETSEGNLYKLYSSRPGLSVAQVSGFRLCDTVRVDVVLLKAESDQAWLQLEEEFGIDDTTGNTSWLSNIDEPATRVKWDGQPVLRVVASHVRRTVGLYRLDNETQYDALLDYQLNNINQN